MKTPQAHLQAVHCVSEHASRCKACERARLASLALRRLQIGSWQQARALKRAGWRQRGGAGASDRARGQRREGDQL
eukprot:842452-Lingulodinium_polyedra.AAC.1